MSSANKNDSNRSETLSSGTTVFGRLIRWARVVSLTRKLSIALAAAAIVSGIATYGAMTGAAPFGSSASNVLILLNIDLVLLLLLGAVVAVRLVRLWLERRRGYAGSQLHSRLVTLFSLVSVTPAIVVAIFSALFLNFGLQAWFSKQVSTALDRSLVVAESYMQEHRQIIRGQALAMANDLNGQAPYLSQNKDRLQPMVDRLAQLRSLSDATVLSRNGKILAHSGLSFALALEHIPETIMQRASTGEVVILTNETDDRVRALVQLAAFVDAYLYVGRYVERRVLNHVEQVQGAVGQYKQLEARQSGFQVTFVLIFVVVALLVLLAAVWVGLAVSNQLVRPISKLIVAAERVREGELSVQVPEVNADDEISSLSRAFNRMTGQLEGQRQDLIDANRQLDERRQFTEAVLGGVSAGVIGLDANGLITLPNRSALALLDVSAEMIVGESVERAIPEIGSLLTEARERPERSIEQQIEIDLRGAKCTLLVRIAVELNDEVVIGYIITFDDITALVSAQRTAAWADVARRIAHEIKNPLTPIQLSAERLKRKYLNEINSEPEIFSACTDTIVRQVDDIRQMVDEFSAFARMPSPIIRTENLSNIAKHAVLLQRVAYPEIEFVLTKSDYSIEVACDFAQISQSLINLLKNSVEAIESNSLNADHKGIIRVSLDTKKGEHSITITDNGPGFPQEKMNRLTEPYVTTRDRGTGLGLAIVSKIMEDHGGTLSLSNEVKGGAVARLIFPELKKVKLTDGGT